MMIFKRKYVCVCAFIIIIVIFLIHLIAIRISRKLLLRRAGFKEPTRIVNRENLFKQSHLRALRRAHFRKLIVLNKQVSVYNWYRSTPKNTSAYKDIVQHVPKYFCQNKSLLVIIVNSSPVNFLRRIALREGWANSTEGNTELVFFIGNSTNDKIQEELNKEINFYNDIIQPEFTDVYVNLTVKTYLMLDIVTKQCKNTKKFLLKADDDIYVNIPLLLQYITEKMDTKNVIIGSIAHKEKPVRHFRYKEFCPEYICNDTYYPDFVRGFSYLMTIDVPQKLIETSLLLPMIHLEDVYFTGHCAKLAEVNLVMNYKFVHKDAKKFDPCFVHKSMVYHTHKSGINYLLRKHSIKPENCT